MPGIVSRESSIDFRNLWDRDLNYFENSRRASTANWEYSTSFGNKYKTYSKDSWGLTACLGPGGYRAYGGKPGLGVHDGTAAAHAVIGSLIFTPEISLPAIKNFYYEHDISLYGSYGFKDSFNLDKKWWRREEIGINQGITVLMLENFLTESGVWQKFMKLPAIQMWIELTRLDPTYSLRKKRMASREAVPSTNSGVK